MKVRPARLIVWILVASIALAVAWSFRPQPVPVDLAAVNRGTLRVTIDEEGVTRVRERFVVSSPVAGRLLRIALEPGDPVVAGKTVLATFLPGTPSLLDPRTRAEAEARMKSAQAARDQARVALQLARDELAFANTELNRHRELAKASVISQEELAAKELEARTRAGQVRAAELALQGAEHELEAARAALQQAAAPTASTGTSRGVIVLRSPIDGVVLRRHHESEALVPAGEPLIEVGDPHSIEVVSDLLSTDAVKVRPGFAVRIDRWGGPAVLQGRVRLVEPAGFTKISALGVEEQRVNAIIDVQDPVSHGHALGDGYRVEVSIIIWERDGVLKVPTSALFKTGDQWTVYVARGGRSELTAVQIGQRNAIEAEVLAGLSQGDQVIVHPGDAIEDGIQVTPRTA